MTAFTTSLYVVLCFFFPQILIVAVIGPSSPNQYHFAVFVIMDGLGLGGGHGAFQALGMLVGTTNKLTDLYLRFRDAPDELRHARDRLQLGCEQLKSFEKHFLGPNSDYAVPEDIERQLQKLAISLKKEIDELEVLMPPATNDSKLNLTSRLTWASVNHKFAEKKLKRLQYLEKGVTDTVLLLN